MLSESKQLGLPRSFDDPLTVMFNDAYNILVCSTAKGGIFNNYQTRLWPTISILWDLHTQNTISFHTSKSAPRLPLENTISASYRIEALFEDALVICNERLKETPAGWRKSAISSFITDYALRLDDFRELVRQMSPTHVKLQTHFYQLIAEMPSDRISNTLAELFAPLYRLRNEYFFNPQLSVLEEYLIASNKIMMDTYYCNIGLREAQLNAEASLVELETEVLLNSMGVS